MKNISSNVGKCLECGSKVEIVDVLENRIGLAHKLTVKCTSCTWEIASIHQAKRSQRLQVVDLTLSLMFDL